MVAAPELPRTLGRLAALAALLVFVVVSSSAYLRLSQSGLGCADWPRCYGRSDMRDAQGQTAPRTRAWVRMTHRLAAMIVSILNLLLAYLCWTRKPPSVRYRAAAVVLIALTVFLSALGRATPSANLPAVTLGNLLGGLSMLALLWWLWLTSRSPYAHGERRPGLARWANLNLGLVIAQIALGGLVTAHYAALACSGFPACNGAWWPGDPAWAEMNPFRAIEHRADGSTVVPQAMATLHMLHRFAAALVAGVAAALGCALAFTAKPFRMLGLALLTVVSLQAGLGIAAVSLSLPLVAAWAHNAAAALLLLASLSAVHRLGRP